MKPVQGERPRSGTGRRIAGKARKQGPGRVRAAREMLGGWPRWSWSLGKDLGLGR